VTDTLLISVRDAARLLGLPHNEVYRLVREGRIPHVRVGASGRGIRIPRQGLGAWVLAEAECHAEDAAGGDGGGHA
jgi:excisionase family DNA binding protein